MSEVIPDAAVGAAQEAVKGAMIEHGPDGHIDGYEEITRAALEAAAAHMPQQVAVIHGGQDMEEHARSFNEGYEAAVTQGLADDPTLAGDWLDAKLAEAKVEALEEAASDIRNDMGIAQRVYLCRWLRARADALRTEA